MTTKVNNRMIDGATVSVIDFGAVPGTDCTAQIEAARDHAISNNAWLEFPASSLPYYVSNPILPKSNMKWRGEGTLSVLAGANCRIIENPESPVVYVDNFELRDLTFDGNRANQTTGTANNDGIKLSFAYEFNIHNIKVKHCGTPETQANPTNNAVGLSLHECGDGNITNCYLSDNMHYNLQVWECNNIVISDIISVNPGSHCYGGAGCTDISWNGCQGRIDANTSNFTYYAGSAGQGMWFRNFARCPITDAVLVKRGVDLSIIGGGVQWADEAGLTSPDSSRMSQRMPTGSRHENQDNPTSGIVHGFTYGYYAHQGVTERMNIKGAHAYECQYGLLQTSGRCIVDGFEARTCEFGISLPGTRDNKLSNITLRNIGRRPIELAGTRSVLTDTKIEEWGTQGVDYGISIADFANDMILSNISIYNSVPAQSAGHLFIGANAARATIQNVNLTGGALIPNNRQDHSVQVIEADIAAADRWRLPQRWGSLYMWIDSAGKMRIRENAPTSDTDGIIVGTQTV